MLIICGLLTVLIEILGFNGKAITERKTELYLGQNNEIPDEIENVEKKTSGIRIVFKEPVYIKKLKFTANIAEKTNYVVFTKKINTFDSEQVEKKQDTYWPELGCGYTSINEKVTTLSLGFSNSKAELQEIWLYNKTEYNKYRMTITFILLLLSLFFLKKWKYVSEKPEYLLLVAGILGACFIYAGGIQENGWDEQIHFMTAYQLSFRGSARETNDALIKMQERISKDMYNTLEEKQLFIQYMNNAYERNKAMTEKTIHWSYNKVGYMNQVVVLWIGRHLNLSFYHLFLFGKLVNLLTYVVLMLLAVKIIPVYKHIIVLLGMIPTQIFIASTYTYDVIVHAGLMLGFACWAKVVFGGNQKKSENRIYMILSIVIIILSSLSKAVYVPLVLLCCFIPKERFASEREFRIFYRIILTGCAVVVMTFSVPLIKYTIYSQTGMMTDSRGGNTDAVLQLQSILQYPVQYIKILTASVMKELSDFCIGHAALANFGRFGELETEFYLITLSWILCCALGIKKTSICSMNRKMRVGIISLSIFVMILIWTSMYLIYTPIGADHINGVQARYYFPILAPVLLTILGGRDIVFSKKNLKFSILFPALLCVIELYKRFICI